MAFPHIPAPDATQTASGKLLSGVSRPALLCAAFALMPQAAFAQTAQPTAAPPSDLTSLASQDQGGQEIVVTGIRAAIAKSLETKRNANSIVDSISSEDIGKLPDNNIAEAIQRIPGVAIDREGGEGRYISINGLGPDFSLTLLNGRQIASADAGRSFSFDTIASQLVHQIDVYKTANANVPEGGLGGTVDVHTARPFDFPGFTASVQAQYQYQGSSKDGAPQASFLISDRFFNGKLGVLVSFTHQKRHTTSYGADTGSWSRNYWVDPAGGFGYAPDELDEAWRVWDMQYQRIDSYRERNGGTVSVQYQPTDTLTLTTDYLYSKFTVNNITDSGGAYLWPVLNSPINVVDSHGAYHALDVGNGLLRSSRSWNHSETKRPTTTQLAGFNAKWNPAANFTGAVDVYWSKAITDNKGLNHSDTTEMGRLPGYTLFLPTDGSTPYMEQQAGLDLSTMSNQLGSLQISNSGTYTKAVNKGITADFDYGVTDSFHFKFGGSYADQTKQNIIYSTPSAVSHLWWSDSFAPPDNLDISSAIDGILYADGRFGVTGTPYPIFLINDSKLRALATDPANLAKYLNYASPNTANDLAAFATNGNSYDAVRTNASYLVQEKDLSLYWMFDTKFEIGSMPVNVVAGMRYSRTSLDSSGTERTLIGFDGNKIRTLNPVYAGETPNGPQVFSPISVKNTYEEFLPSFNAKVGLTNNLVARFAVTRTMSRPTLDDLAPGLSYGGMNFKTRSASGHNPFLKPFTSTNYDASLEYYYSRHGALAISGFYKDVSNLIVTTTSIEKLTTVGFVRNLIDESSGTPFSMTLDEAQTFQVTRPENVASATIKGLAAAWTHTLDFGLGIQANYTKVWSKASTAPGLNFAVPGISDTANIVGFYEKYGISARLAWNWRSTFLIDPGIPGRIWPTSGNAYQQFDARIGYTIPWGVSLSADVVNLTNEKPGKHAMYEDDFISSNAYGRQFTFTVSKKF